MSRSTWQNERSNEVTGVSSRLPRHAPEFPRGAARDRVGDPQNAVILRGLG